MSARLGLDLEHASPEMLALLAKTPLIAPPEGVKPNFVDPATIGPLQNKVLSVILAFTIMFFSNRFYVKIFLIRKLTWDDGTTWMLNSLIGLTLTNTLGTLLISMIGVVVYFFTCIWGK